MKNPLAVFSRRATLPSSWRAMEDLQNEMDRWIEDRFSRISTIPEGFDFAPAAELQENKNEYMLRLDLPGVGKDEVKIEVDGNRITVSGERKEEKEEKDAKRYFAESYYGSFLRSFTLPEDIDEKQVKAQFKDGVLKISIPRSGERAVKSVPIQ